jgi:radical SAM superfamily enzyme YgiQ (UPF0313 family)
MNQRNDDKKIVFVEPRGAPSNVFTKFMSIPLLGPVYLATIVKQAGYDVVVLNENILGRNVTAEELVSADVLCLSCITATSNRGKEIAVQYKAVRKAQGLDSRAIIGGIHASTIPEDVIPYFDQVVIGEAEHIILDLLAGNIKDKVVHAPRPENLDTFPVPDFTLIKNWKNRYTHSVMSSRGCPYGCNFCAVTEMFGRKYRSQSPERVMNEIMQYDRGDIFFADDHFAANLTRTNRILDLMIENDFKRPWSCQVRSDVTRNPEFVSKMRRAGCNTVYIGFESINEKSLIDMNKRQTRQDIERAIKAFHDNGIGIHGMFMLGNDADDRNVFKNTSEFCRKADLDSVQYAVLTPLPGTQTYYKLQGEQRLLHHDWQYYDGLHAVFKPTHMTAHELQKGMITCFAEFYSYTNALKKTFNAFLDAAVISAKGMYSRIRLPRLPPMPQMPHLPSVKLPQLPHVKLPSVKLPVIKLPSFKPALLRAGGRQIINKWLLHNREYMKYLKTLSHPSPAND